MQKTPLCERGAGFGNPIRRLLAKGYSALVESSIGAEELGSEDWVAWKVARARQMREDSGLD